MLVGFTILIAVIGVASPLVVRHGRLLKSHRNYRLALDELSNQLDRLSSLPMEQLPDEIEQLSPSTFLTDRLPGVQLSGELQPVESGMRITLKLSWNETQREGAPVTLAAWVFPAASEAGSKPVEAKPQ
jgi:hypothetical protein